MATTKIWAIKTNLETLVNYVSDTKKTENKNFEMLKNTINYAESDAKTEQKLFVTGINCNSETAYKSMKAAHRKSTKQIKVLGYHAYQSFKSGEVTADKAHEIGIKLATELWGDKFQVVVATHKNTKNIHNHFVLCATSFLDGKRFHACKDSYRKMREISDRLCKEHELSVIDNPVSGKTMHYTEHLAERQGKMTWRGLIREDIDRAILKSSSTVSFWQNMEDMGYKLKMNVKYPAIKPPGHERYFRLYNLGDNYTPDAIKKRILENERMKILKLDPPNKRRYKTSGQYRKQGKVKGFRALYLFYSYKLGILPKKRSSNKRMHFLLREDLLKMNSIIAQSKILLKNNIDTFDDLEKYKSKVFFECQELMTMRKILKNEVRKALPEDIKEKKVKKISQISKQIKQKRKELKLCEEIKDRSEKQRENLKKITDFEKKTGREKGDYDEHSR